MEEYYIRTPGQDESRGPFDLAKLQTLIEADQINKNTLYYNEEKSEWVPIGLDEALKAALLPEKKKLSLKARSEPEAEVESEPEEESAFGVEEMLAAAEGDTEETRHLKDQQKSLERATSISSMSLAIMMLLSAVFLGAPFLETIIAVTEGGEVATLLNSPFFLVAAIDCILAIALMLAVTEIFPIIRARAMLSIGFGTYLGWAIGDPILIIAFSLGGIGLFYATMARSLMPMIGAVTLGIGGHGYLAYLAISGRFEGFFDVIKLNLIPIS